MIGTHPNFEQPSHPSIKIWRYMDLSKYISLLQSKSLYMTRSDLLGDPFEGSYTRNMDRTWAKDLPGAVRKQMYVSCWHMNEGESTAMWKLYSQSCDAVAVMTRYESLAKALSDDTYMGVVKYIDFEEEHFDAGNMYGPFLYKRASFAHEREMRAIYWILPKIADDFPDGALFEKNGPETPAFVAKPLDLANLVEAVYVSPTSPSWFLDVVDGVTKTYGYNFPVLPSNIALMPNI